MSVDGLTRAELAHFWDEQLDLWLRDRPLDPTLQEWKRAWRGDVDEWAFPEPWMGPLLGSPRIIIGGLNPGRAHETLQSRTGVSAKSIHTLGFTAWAAPRPYNIPDGEWQQQGFGNIRLDEDRLRFARDFLDDPSIQFGDILTIELYPWHSPGLGKHAIRVQPQTLQQFIFEPLRDLADMDVPVVMFRTAWRDALQRAPHLAELVHAFDDFTLPRRRAQLWRTSQGGRVLVEWHGQFDPLPAGHDTERLRAAWFVDDDGLAVDAHESVQPRGVIRRSTEALTGEARPTRGRSVASTARPRFESAHELALSVKSEMIRSLIFSLPDWVSEEFEGHAVAVRQPTGQFRLRVLGEAPQIGWDFKQDWIYVWVNKPLPGDLETLCSTLSNPSAKRTPSGYLRFQVRNDDDAEALRALIGRHVTAARQQAGVLP